MHAVVLRTWLVIVFLLAGVHNILGKPHYRIKRVSDSHLADLETKIALNNKLKGLAITMPIAGGKLDPYRIGRKRRSQSQFLDLLFNQSEEDNSDPLEEEYDERFVRRLTSNAAFEEDFS